MPEVNECMHLTNEEFYKIVAENFIKQLDLDIEDINSMYCVQNLFYDEPEQFIVSFKLATNPKMVYYVIFKWRKDNECYSNVKFKYYICYEDEKESPTINDYDGSIIFFSINKGEFSFFGCSKKEINEVRNTIKNCMIYKI